MQNDLRREPFAPGRPMRLIAKGRATNRVHVFSARSHYIAGAEQLAQALQSDALAGQVTVATRKCRLRIVRVVRRVPALADFSIFQLRRDIG